MIRILDEGGLFEAPIDLVWRYLQSAEEHARAHRQRDGSLKRVAENQLIVSWWQDFDGRSLRMTTRITVLHPTGLAIEVLEGPLAGSKFFNYYTPRGDRTEVTVVGDFGSKSVPEPELPGIVSQFLASAFQEDAEGLRRMSGKR